MVREIADHMKENGWEGEAQHLLEKWETWRTDQQ